jgi:hypothetical protein
MIDASRLDHPGDERGSDGPSAVMVLAGITEVRHDNSDRRCTTTPRCIGEEQQLHQMGIGWGARGLDDAHVCVGDRIEQLDVRFKVGKASDDRIHKRRIERLTNGHGERRICSSIDDAQPHAVAFSFLNAARIDATSSSGTGSK